MTTTHTNQIIVFVGPTLTQEEAYKILPNACYHLPAKCGDIFRVCRLLPNTIILIDGFFEQSASVWHKEILFAISQGITVYGASSMGALRAAELHEYGMIGSGKIYTYYKNKDIITDDDEVAVTHTVKNNQYNTHIIPLINLRFTLEKAVKKQILEACEASDIFLKIKSIPYFQRDLISIEKTVSNQVFFQWIKSNYVDQKKLDAIQMLETVAKNKNNRREQNPNLFKSTFFIRKLYRQIANSSFETRYEWLPSKEKLLSKYKNTNMFLHLKTLSNLIQISNDIYLTKNKNFEKEQSVDLFLLLQRAIMTVDVKILKDIFKFYLIYTEMYFDYKEMTGNWKKVKNIIFLICLFLCFIIYTINEMNITINNQYMDLFLEDIRRNKFLWKASDTFTWLKNNGIKTKSDYHQFLSIGSIFHYLVILNNVELIGIEISIDKTPWLVESLLFSRKAEEMLNHVSIKDAFILD